MARRGTPALYELLGRGRDPKNPGKGVGPGAKAPRFTLDPATMRVAGLAFLVLFLFTGVYLIGVWRGGGWSNSADDASGSIADGGAGTANDPMALSTAPAETTDGSRNASPSERSENPEVVRPTPPAPDGSGASSGRRVANPADSSLGPPLAPAPHGLDPRQAGLQYCVLATVPEANADKLVQFCRDLGLDAWVVPDDSGRLREITVLPGVPKSELKGAAATALGVRIAQVGARWKAAGKGNSDFHDRYFKPFNGSRGK